MQQEVKVTTARLVLKVSCSKSPMTQWKFTTEKSCQTSYKIRSVYFYLVKVSNVLLVFHRTSYFLVSL